MTLIFAVFERRLIQHWMNCMHFFLCNICGFSKVSQRWQYTLPLH